MSGIRCRSSCASDLGLVRQNNEDSVFADDGLRLYVVADGVGGAAAGEIASQSLVSDLRRAGTRLHELADGCDAAAQDGRCRRTVFDELQAVIEESNRKIFERSQDDPELRGMATTASILLMTQIGAFVSHVGDSRIYHLRDGHLRRITQDHTWAEQLIRRGLLAREDVPEWRFRNVIVRCVGGQQIVEPDFFFLDVQPGDLFLLCSDGLTDYAAEDDIRDSLCGKPLAEAADSLVELAKNGGGGDNVSVIVVSACAREEDLETTQRIAYPQKIALLRHLEFFRHLTDSEILKVLRYAIELEIPVGKAVHKQGDPGGDLHIIAAGAVDVIVDGKRVTTLAAGQHFGQLSLVSGSPHSGTVVAREETRLFRLSHDDFYDLSAKDQAVAVKILWGFVQHLGERVKELSRQTSG